MIDFIVFGVIFQSFVEKSVIPWGQKKGQSPPGSTDDETAQISVTGLAPPPFYPLRMWKVKDQKGKEPIGRPGLEPLTSFLPLHDSSLCLRNKPGEINPRE